MQPARRCAVRVVTVLVLADQAIERVGRWDAAVELCLQQRRFQPLAVDVAQIALPRDCRQPARWLDVALAQHGGQPAAVGERGR